MDFLVFVDWHTQILVTWVHLHLWTLRFGRAVTNSDTLHGASLAKYGLILVNRFAEISILFIVLAFGQRWTRA